MMQLDTFSEISAKANSWMSPGGGHLSSQYFFFKIRMSHLFLAALSLHCCVWAFSRCGEPGLLFMLCNAQWLLLCQNRGSQCQGSVVGTWASVPRHVGSWSWMGIEPMFPALVGGFLTTGLQGSPRCFWMSAWPSAQQEWWFGFWIFPCSLLLPPWLLLSCR